MAIKSTHVGVAIGTVVAVGILFGTASCNDEGQPNQICEPGLQRTCPCLGEETGFQTCESDGTSWGECQCNPPHDGGNGQGDTSTVDSGASAYDVTDVHHDASTVDAEEPLDTDTDSETDSCTASDETCDGRDNDCDGQIDENVTAECSKQSGVCKGASKQCLDGQYPSCGKEEYGSDYAPIEILCDGKDNDCDGVVGGPIKCDSVRLIGSSGNETSTDVALGGSGEIHVVGDIGTSFGGQTYNGGVSDGYIVKYDASLNRKWVRLVGTSEDDKIYDVEVDNSGSIYVMGKAGARLGGNQYNHEEKYIAKFTPDGQRSWVLMNEQGLDGGNSTAGAEDMTVDENGNVYVAGSTASGFGGESYNGGTYDGYFAKFDSSGNRQQVRLVGTSGEDEANGIAVDSNDAVYVVGKTDRGFGGQSFNGGPGDGFVAKFDASGTRKYTDLVGTSGSDNAREVAVTVGGNFYVVGTTDTSLGGGNYNGGKQDGFVAKYEGTGNRKWERLVGRSGEDFLLSVDVDGSGNVYLAGNTEDPTEQDPGGRDGYVVSYAGSGSLNWTRLVSSSGDDSAIGIAVDGPGRVQVVGDVAGKLGGRTFNGGISDGFVMLLK